jgi:hypothetical protein
MWTGGLQGYGEREVPNQAARRIKTLPANLTDSFFLTSSDHPVLTIDPEQAAVQVIMVREEGLLHLTSDREQEDTASSTQHYSLLVCNSNYLPRDQGQGNSGSYKLSNTIQSGLD